MSVTIPSLDPVTDILDTDKIMVTQSSGQTYTIDGASFNKRNQAVIANSTTLTGAPLKTGNIVRAYFTADITGVNTSTGLVLNYNGSNKNVKVPKNGALVNFTAQNLGGTPTVYKYLQAYTTLELLYDGTNFVINGNPVVISSEDYTIYADGKKIFETQKNWTSINANNDYHIKNGMVILRGFSNNDKVIYANTYTNVGTLPENIRPSTSLDFPLTFVGGQQIGFVRINTNGNIDCYVNSTTGYWTYTAIII